MARILITEFMDPAAVRRLAERHEVLYQADLVDHPQALREAAAGVQALIVRNRTQVRGDLLAALDGCRVVGRLGVGLDNIDLDGCRARGIEVIPALGANADSVAEYTLATAMMLLRGLHAATAAVAGGQWPREAFSRGREIGGKTLGIVGFGDIGRRTAAKASALGLRVLAWQGRRPPQDPVFREAGVAALPLDELLAQADVVSLNLPLNADTRGLFDAQRLSRMKPGAVLINTARGGIVDERALAQALREGRLGGAALDVFETEPLPPAPHFQDCPNLVLTPHIAGVSVEANERVSGVIAEAVLRALG